MKTLCHTPTHGRVQPRCRESRWPQRAAAEESLVAVPIFSTQRGYTRREVVVNVILGRCKLGEWWQERCLAACISPMEDLTHKERERQKTTAFL